MSFQTISAYSGHYRPSDESLETFLSFLRENEVSLDDVEVNSCSTEPYTIKSWLQNDTISVTQDTYFGKEIV